MQRSLIMAAPLTLAVPIVIGLGAIRLILAWKVAGYYGLDRWLLPRLGTPWRPGALFARRGQPTA